MNWLDAQLILDAPRLRQEREHLVRAYLWAGKIALLDTTQESERELERVTQEQVPGRLWRAWRSRVEPRGARIARDPAGYIFLNGGTRTRGAMQYFTETGRVSGQGRSGWTAVPLPSAGNRGRMRNLTPADWEARTGIKLRPVFRPGKLPLLVADDAVLSGKRQVARRNTEKRIAAGRGSATVPIFVLLPARDFKGRFSVASVLSPAPGRLSQNFQQQARLVRDVRGRA